MNYSNSFNINVHMKIHYKCVPYNPTEHSTKIYFTVSGICFQNECHRYIYQISIKNRVKQCLNIKLYSQQQIFPVDFFPSLQWTETETSQKTHRLYCTACSNITGPVYLAGFQEHTQFQTHTIPRLRIDIHI